MRHRLLSTFEKDTIRCVERLAMTFIPSLCEFYGVSRADAVEADVEGTSRGCLSGLASFPTQKQNKAHKGAMADSDVLPSKSFNFQFFSSHSMR